MTLAEHRSTYPAPHSGHARPNPAIIDAVDAAGLRGRGGGGFPTGRKMRAVLAAKGRAVVLVNGSEGEPASRKDKLLMQRAPHLVLDGALIAARAVGADEIHLGIERSEPAVIAAIQHAIGERISAHERSVPIHVSAVPPRYVAGEESALVHFVNGGEAKPTSVPPRPFERGIANRPTLVDNVETLAHVAQIWRWGPTWFRELGLADEPGTILVTTSGALTQNGISEVPIDIDLAKLVRAFGGVTAPVSAVLVGGYYGTWLGPDQLPGARLSNTYLKPIGASVGCGALMFMAQGCGICETARVLGWMASESAGQCGPCVHGLAALAGAFRALARGEASARTIADIERWGGQMMGRGACSFPDGGVRLARSALRAFAYDVRVHLTSGPCVDAHRPPLLHIPHVDQTVWR
jgi:NADH:ubiquinone oxidoreductase subunit F (NADH-binding)